MAKKKTGYDKPRYERETTRPKNFDVDVLVAELDGSRGSIQSCLPDGMLETDLTTDDKRKISESIFYCNDCATWKEIEERSDDDDCCVECNIGD